MISVVKTEPAEALSQVKGLADDSSSQVPSLEPTEMWIERESPP